MTLDPNRVIELENENKSLSAKLVGTLEKTIKELEAENESLKRELASRPIDLKPATYPKPKLRTMSELSRFLELRSIVK